MIADDYPLARDPAGPWDVTVKFYEDEQEWVCRAPWRKLPTLRECNAYIVHGVTYPTGKITNEETNQKQKEQNDISN